MFVYIMMAFFQIPTWCLDKDDIKDLVTCDNHIYPNSHIPKMPHIYSGLLEICCLWILLFNVIFRRTFKVPSKNSKIREAIHVILTLIAIVDIIVDLIRDKGGYFAEYIRVVLIVLFLRSLRETLNRILLVVYDSKEILWLIIAYIIFSGWVGYKLFKGTLEGIEYFSDYIEGWWNLLILLTTANFPDIMLPAYRMNRLYAIFFLLYLIIGLFFLLNLILAIYFSNYKNRVERSINTYIKMRENFLREKFNNYDLEKKGYISLHQCKLLVQELLKTSQNSTVSKRIDIDKITKVFDSKSEGKITVENFINYFYLLDVVTSAQKTTSHCHHNSGKFKRMLRKMFKNPYYELGVLIFIFLSLWFVFGIDYMEYYGNSKTSVYAWIICQFTFNNFFLIEMVLLFYSYGLKHMFTQRNHVKIEAIIQWINIAMMIDFAIDSKLDLSIKFLEISMLSKFSIN